MAPVVVALAHSHLGQQRVVLGLADKVTLVALAKTAHRMPMLKSVAAVAALRLLVRLAQALPVVMVARVPQVQLLALR